MDMFAQFTWVLGVLLLAAVLIQALLVAYAAVRRLGHEGACLRQARELIDLRIAAARRQYERDQEKSGAWVGWRKFEVRWKRPENRRGDICSFYLAAHDGKPIPRFEPGQFLTFRLDVPGQSKPVVRCYSLSDSSKPDYFRVSIRRIPAPPGSDLPPGLSSGFFHDHVHEGSILDVKAPAGNFFLDESRADPVVLVGGGIGVTPVLSMLNAIVDSGIPRETWFFLAVRNGDDHPMREHLEAVARENPNVHLVVCYSEAREGIDHEGVDYQYAGHVGVSLFRTLLPSNNYHWHFCGPPPMMQSLQNDLKDWGVPEQRIHYEKFGPGPKRHEAPAVDAERADVAGIEVSFSRSGKTLKWTPAQGSLLELARGHGIDIESGCEQGDCGTCRTAVRSGEVEYIDTPACEIEQGTCLVCVCRPKGALVLDA